MMARALCVPSRTFLLRKQAQASRSIAPALYELNESSKYDKMTADLHALLTQTRSHMAALEVFRTVLVAQKSATPRTSLHEVTSVVKDVIL